jgi:NAD+ kinase
MKIAIYGRRFNKEFYPAAELLFSKLQEIASDITVFKGFHDFITKETGILPEAHSLFDKPFDEHNKPDMLFSIGGDGTFLDSTEYAGKLNIPIAGINSGRLGFLANISEPEIEQSLNKIKEQQYSLEERILLKVSSGGENLTAFPYCLNEVSIQKQSTDSMITVSVKIDNEFINSYWADGLIIATPTGSTAYSLSVGGPIMLPEAQSIIIIPIAPHNLNVRPIIIPDYKTISISTRSRSGKFLCSADSRTVVMDTDKAIQIQTADFKIKTVLPDEKNFYDTLRNKLMWGVDKRN